jgi:hypothetical protein
MPDNGVGHWRHFGLRLHPRLSQRSRLGQCGRRLLARPPVASAPIRGEAGVRGSDQPRAGTQRRHELGTAWRLAGFRGTLAGFCRRGQGAFATLSKFGHPRGERRLHNGGMDVPQGVLGVKGTLRPCGGFIRGGEARKLADQPIAQSR